MEDSDKILCISSNSLLFASAVTRWDTCASSVMLVSTSPAMKVARTTYSGTECAVKKRSIPELLLDSTLVPSLPRALI